MVFLIEFLLSLLALLFMLLCLLFLAWDGFEIFKDIRSIVIEMKEDIKEFRSNKKKIEGGKING